MSNEISLEAINDMYRLVNENAQKILDSLTEKDSVKKYLGTLDVNNVSDEYKKNYNDFYVMRGNNKNFLSYYFEVLKSGKIKKADSEENDIDETVNGLFELCEYFESIPCNKKDTKKIHFSFTTKLFHTLFNEFPIYDNNIESFFFFEDIEKIKPRQNKNEDEDSYKERVKKIKYAEYKKRYKFLVNEYNRIENEKLLNVAITLFENGITCKSTDKNEKEITFKDISYAKKIDFAIWGFIGLVKDSAILNNKIVYKNERLFTK